MRPFRAILAQENVETEEGWLIREFPAGCFSWRALPMTLMAQVTTPEFGGHAGAFILGRIDTIEREGDFIVGTGVLDDEGEGADADRRRDVIRQIGENFLNGVSVDPGGVEVTESCEVWNEDEPDWCDVVRVRFDSYTIGEATATTLPALEGTLIELTEASTDEGAVAASALPQLADDLDAVVAALTQEALVAAGGLVPAGPPPLSHFADPIDVLSADDMSPRLPRHLGDGRIVGYLASWQDCHISMPTHCQTPWRSATDYAYAHASDFPGGILDEDGRVVSLAVMPIAVRGGHYPTDPEHARDWRGAQAHYDDPTSVAMYARVYEHELGLAFSGAVWQGVDPRLLAVFMAHPLSTDHRRIPPGSGSMELVGACSVVVKGFVRSVALDAVGASGEQEPIAAVVAGGVRTRNGACCDGCAHGHPCDASTARGAPSAEQQLATLQRGVDRLLAHLEPGLRAEAIQRLRTGVRATT